MTAARTSAGPREARQGPRAALELKDVELKQEGGTWAGSAKPAADRPDLRVAGRLGIKDGGFDYLKGGIGGLNKPIGSGVFLQSIGFEVRVALRLAG